MISKGSYRKHDRSPVGELQYDNPIGKGLGIYTGFSVFTGTQEKLNLAYNESVASKIAVEAGLLGFVAVGLGFGMIQCSAAWMATLIGPKMKLALIPTFCGSLIALFYGLWYDHNASGLWWWTLALSLGQGLVIPLGKRNLASTGRKPYVNYVGNTAFRPRSESCFQLTLHGRRLSPAGEPHSKYILL